MTPTPKESSTSYDAHGKEASLRAASEAWDTANLGTATDTDIPRIDIGPYWAGDKDALAEIVSQLRHACTHVGFYYLTGHGLEQYIQTMLTVARSLFDLPLATKQKLCMDQARHKAPGIGYLPLHHHKLPKRQRPNANECFIVKARQGLEWQDNPWPAVDLPEFSSNVMAYAEKMQTLAMQLLPLYARVLDMGPDFFDAAFTQPTMRLRMTKYPPSADNSSSFGIAPHVDTSFITLLAQDAPGLVIYSEAKHQWLRAPHVPGALVVNTGELLRQWTNDVFVSVKHFANNDEDATAIPRYSIPFFLNANADYRMTCIPSCCSASNPPKYPPFSYDEPSGKRCPNGTATDHPTPSKHDQSDDSPAHAHLC